MSFFLETLIYIFSSLLPQGVGMPFDWGQCQIPYPSPGPKGWGFQLTGALNYVCRKRVIMLRDEKHVVI